ncbi:MAG TPA: helix-turn-helix transcriptional regulator [Nocardioidaceae bacterium]|nr:helix-turn-helix transcriptional regulator [Nocardioidaceae bacterium]
MTYSDAPAMTVESTLGERIRGLRAAGGLSQADLAGPDMSASYISLIESGKRQPTLDVLTVLAERLHTTVENLTTGVETPVEHSLSEVDLELRFAKIALRSGNAESAEKSARAVLRDPARSSAQRLEALATLAGAVEAQGKLTEAIDVLEPLLEELDADQTRELWRSCQVMLCRCYKESGDLAHAIDLGERVLSAEGTLSDDEVMLAISLAGAYNRRGDTTRAGRLLAKMLDRAEVAGSQRNRGAALWNSALIADTEGRHDDAVRLSEQALALFSESDAVRNLGKLRANYGILLREDSSSSTPLAREQLSRALAEFEMEGSVIDRARCLTELARCALDEDDVVEADRLSVEARGLVAECSDGERAYVEQVRGHVLVRQGSVHDGLLTAHRAALVLHDQADSPADAAQAWRELAALATSVGDHRLAVGALERATEVLGVRPVRVGTARPVESLVGASVPVEATPVESPVEYAMAGAPVEVAPVENAIYGGGGPVEKPAPVEARGPVE